MGILDSIFGLSGSENTQAAVGQGITGINQGVTGANQTLSNTARNAADAYKTGAANASDALTAGFGEARNDLLNYGGQAQGQLASGRDAAVGTILGGNAAYAPYSASGGAANVMQANALGLNGAAGHDAATAAFRADPGYAFTRDEANDATARKMASLGMAGSGNTLDAILKQSSSLADQTYQSWLTNLGNLSTTGLNAANSISNNNQAAGGIQFNAGSQGAQLSQNLGSSLGSLGTGLGTALGSISSNLGNSLGGLQQSLGQQKASNIFGGATSSASLGVTGGQAADSADNANNAAISKLIGGVVGLPMSGGTTALNPGGLQVTPGTNGSFTFSPTAASTSGHGLLGAMGLKL